MRQNTTHQPMPAAGPLLGPGFPHAAGLPVQRSAGGRCGLDVASGR